MPPFMLNNSLDHLPLMWEPFWHSGLGILLALVVPTLFCFVFGSLMFRARVSGPFFAIMTLAMLSALYTLVIDEQPFTNGVNGITPPQPLAIGSITFDPYSVTTYGVVCGLLILTTTAAKLLTQSKFGLLVQAVRGDAERVRFLGYNVAAYETATYTFSGFIAAIAGCCWVMLVQYVSPAQMDVGFSVTMVIWAGVGGRLSLLGSILGAFIIQGGQSYLGDTFLNTWLLGLGAFFIIVVRFLPKGLAGLLETCLGALPRRHDGGKGFRAREGANVIAGE
jgi:urea transport system permease protein